MSRILVTGGSGALGRVLVAKLAADPANLVRVMSRHQKSADAPALLEWAQADLQSGIGLGEAVSDIQTILHTATGGYNHAQSVDVEGTRRLVQQARAARVQHLIYISIVGVDRIPNDFFRAKLAAEEIVAQGDVPWTILRATQFHYLLDVVLGALLKFPIGLWFTDLPWQPVATEEVADSLVQSAMEGATGRLPDLGGPEVLSGSEIARTWLQVRGINRRILPLRLPGKTADALRHGGHTCPENRRGKVTWRGWLERKYRGAFDAQPTAPIDHVRSSA